MSVALVKLDGVAKSFAGVQALQATHLELAAGEVLGLVGERGAGKSTLIKILSGVHMPDQGSILLEGKQIQFDSPRAALEAGIATIHQELAYFGQLSVAENLLMGERWPRRGGAGQLAPVAFGSAAQLDRFNLEIPTQAAFHELSARSGRKWRLPARSPGARLLILDEPTASLSEPEVRRLFSHLHRLRQDGVSILYVSHRR